MTSRKALVDLLLASGIASDEEAQQLAAISPPPGSTWAIEVLNSGKVDEHKFAAGLGELFKMPLVSVEAAKIDRPLQQLLPTRFVFKHQVLPIEASEKSVKLATYDPFNSTARRFAAQQLAGRAIEWAVTPRGTLLRAIKTLYGVGAETFDEILKNARSYDESIEREQAHDIANDDPEASVVKFVNQVIREAIYERATDIHVEPLENDLRIRYRIDGILH